MKRKFSALVVVAFATMGVLSMLASPAGAQNFLYQCPSTLPAFSQTDVIIDINGVLSEEIVQQGDTLSLTDVVASLTLNVPAFPIVAQVPTSSWRLPIPPGIEYVDGSGTFGGSFMPGDPNPVSGTVALDGTDLLISIDPFQIDLAQLIDPDGNVVPLPVGALDADFLVTADAGELKFGSGDIIIDVVLVQTPFTLSCANDDPTNFFLAAGINQPPPELPPEPTAPPATVAAAVAAPPAAPADLPRTGTATLPTVFAGLTLVLLGAVFVRVRRARHVAQELTP